MATTEVCPSTEERQASQFWGAHGWSFLERFPEEAGGRSFVDCIGCTPGLRHPPCTSSFDQFEIIDPSMIQRLISNEAGKSCELDSVPSWVIQKFVWRTFAIRCRTFQRFDEQRFFPNISKDRFHHSNSQEGDSWSVRSQQLETHFKPDVPI